MVSHRFCATCLAFVAVAWANGARAASVVDFDTVAPGTLYGVLGDHSPGDLVLSQGGIDMFVENFLFESTPLFVQAEVGGRFGEYFPTVPLSLDNISVRFDFGNAGFDVDEVTFAFQEFGGTSNFAVNGGPIIDLPQLALLPSDIAPGVIASVDGGVITLTGDITEFLIGGQELAIDDIAALPEPTTIILLTLAAMFAQRRRVV